MLNDKLISPTSSLAIDLKKKLSVKTMENSEILLRMFKEGCDAAWLGWEH